MIANQLGYFDLFKLSERRNKKGAKKSFCWNGESEKGPEQVNCLN